MAFDSECTANKSREVETDERLPGQLPAPTFDLDTWVSNYDGM